MAKQADGSVVVRYGDTMLLVTAVSAAEKKDVDFLPLTVEYQEKLYSAGRIPGSYFKREGRLTEKETLTSPSGRPLLPPAVPRGLRLRDAGHRRASSPSDPENEGDIHGITGASAALWVLGHPVQRPDRRHPRGPRGRQVRRQPHAQAARAERHRPGHGRARSEAIVMVEGGAEEVSEADMVAALEFGKQAVQPLLDAAGRDARASSARQTRAYEKARRRDEGLKAKVRALAWDGIVKRLRHQREARALRRARRKAKKEAVAKLKEQLGEAFTPSVEKRAKAVVEDLKYDHMREITVNGGRIGGREHDEVRAITCEVGVLPAHPRLGALHPRRDAGAGGRHPRHQRRRAADRAARRAWPSSSSCCTTTSRRSRVNETKPLRGPGRREIGHGALAERALRNMLPESESFPYTVRIVSDILESNGSLVHGLGLRRHAGADGRGRAHQGAGGRHRHGPGEGGREDRHPLRHPRRRGPPGRHGLQGLRHREGHHRPSRWTSRSPASPRRS